MADKAWLSRRGQVSSNYRRLERRALTYIIAVKPMAACADGSDKNCNAKLQLNPIFATAPRLVCGKTTVYTLAVAHEHN